MLAAKLADKRLCSFTWKVAMKYLYPSLTLAFFHLACSNVKLQPDVKKDSPSENAETKEQVVPPNQISGAFLHCAFESEASDAKPEALVGCRLDDANGKRVPSSAIAASTEFSFAPTLPDADLQVLAMALANDNRYDVAYLFKGISKDKVNKSALATRIYFSFPKVSSTGQPGAVSGILSNIKRDANTLPEPRQTDYNQVQQQVYSEPPLPAIPSDTGGVVPNFDKFFPTFFEYSLKMTIFF